MVDQQGLEPWTIRLWAERSNRLSYWSKIFMVAAEGLEPTANRVWTEYSTNWATQRHGGPDRDRTGYLLNANQALSQVSYRPNINGRDDRIWTCALLLPKQTRYQATLHPEILAMARLTRIERATLRFVVWYSIQLSYRRTLFANLPIYIRLIFLILQEKILQDWRFRSESNWRSLSCSQLP